MSSYLFELNDYHAVKKAEIVIDGITVLSGLNGSGKSTVARWLHHVVKVLNEYDSMVEKEGVEQFLSFLLKIRRVAVDLDNSPEQRNLYGVYDEANAANLKSMSETADYFDRTISLLQYALLQLDQSELQRYQSFFHTILDESDKASEYVDKVTANLRNEYLNIIGNISKRKSQRNIESFSEQLFSIADNDIEGSELLINFKEDGTNLLLSDTFKIPLNLRNVIYIDTQKIGRALELFNKSELSEMLYTKRDDTNAEAKAIARVIQDIIGGDVNVKTNENTFFSPRSRYMFVSKGGDSFNLRGAATGIISFSYILQLVKNGWIDDGTLLIIDEPECHLHPQWIVDYARMLVLLNKKLGTKVLISSHNPDMVSAIESIARKEGISEQTNFYLSEKDPESEGQFVFHNLGNNIEKIFDSFNIAIERISDYGTQN